MKPVHEWNEEFILNLPLGEFDWYEAKGRRALDLTLANVQERDVRQTLSVAVSAFANSGGGVLVYGLKNPDTTAGQWQVDDGGISTSIQHDTREWLETVIPHLVDFPLTTFNVYAILPNTPTSHIRSGRALYVIDIPDSPLAPHQAQDNKYYIRTAGRSRPINHRLVTDIIGRRQYPKLELDFFVRSAETPIYKKVELIIKAKNVGGIYAQYVNCLIYLPRVFASHKVSLFNRNTTEIEGKPYFTLKRTNTRRDVLEEDGAGRQTLGTSWFDPLLPLQEYTWTWELPKNMSQDDLESVDDIIWEVFADNAPKRSGRLCIKDIPHLREVAGIPKITQVVMHEAAPRIYFTVIALVFAIAISGSCMWLMSMFI